jgi:hypothetical protein
MAQDGTVPNSGEDPKPFRALVTNGSITTPQQATIVRAEASDGDVTVTTYWHYPDEPEPGDPEKDTEPYVVVDVDTLWDEDDPLGRNCRLRLYMNDWAIFDFKKKPTPVTHAVTVWHLTVDSDDIRDGTIYDTAWVTFVLPTEAAVYAKMRELFTGPFDEPLPEDDGALIGELTENRSVTLYLDSHTLEVSL